MIRRKCTVDRNNAGYHKKRAGFNKSSLYSDEFM